VTYINRVGSVQDEDGRWHHRFSQSFIGTATDCPEQARRYHAKLLPPDNTDAAAVGTAVHAGIELALTEGQTFDACMEAIEDAWYEEQREPDFRWTKYSGNTAWKLIEACWASWWNGFQPRTREQQGWECEQKFAVPLVDEPDRIIELTGTIDAFDGFNVYDWKTTGDEDKWDDSKQREMRRWAIQPTAYTYAHNYLFQTNPVFTWVVLTPGGCKQIPTTRSEQDWEWLKEQATALAVLIEADLPVWPKNDQHWLCSAKWCVAWDDCKGKHIND